MSFVARIVSCVTVTAACHFVLIAIFGAFGQSSEKSVIWAMTILVSSPAWAVALARPLADAVPAAYNALRWLVWRRDDGRWYAYEGRQLRVFTEDGAPWIAVRDIAAVMAWEKLEERCRLLPPEQCRVVEREDLLCLSETGIAALFSRRTHPEALRFGIWIERNVLMQFRLARERGLRPPRT